MPDRADAHVMHSADAMGISRGNAVAVATDCPGYPAKPPYAATTSHPESVFDWDRTAETQNHAYEGVRDVLRLLGYDKAHQNEKSWNPLGEIIRPGNTVVLKPNLVREFRETWPGHEDCLITHGSIIRVVLDYVYIALRGEGRVIIADAPHNDADFDVIRRIAGLDEIREFYRKHAHFDVEVHDLRPEKARKIDGVIVGHETLPGDPAGYVKVDLGRQSMFSEVEPLCHLLYGSEYDTREVCSHHTGGLHEYLVSRSVLQADCVISLPKLKTHKKTGITACMKNLVGINGNKNWLPHHRLGMPAEGGDQFADDGVRHRLERKAMACFRAVFPLLGPLRGMVAKPVKALGRRVFGDTNTNTIRSGNWYGNDTTWRMVIDLNRILRYAGHDGRLQDTPARHVFCLVDGIVGGEGNGPLDPTPKAAGVIVAGENPVAVDLVCANLMGFDYHSVPVLLQSLAEHPRPLCHFGYDDIVCRSNTESLNRPLAMLAGGFVPFAPHFGWRGHIERKGVPGPDGRANTSTEGICCRKL